VTVMHLPLTIFIFRNAQISGYYLLISEQTFQRAWKGTRISVSL